MSTAVVVIMTVSAQAVTKAILMAKMPEQPLLDVAPNGWSVATYHGTGVEATRHRTLDGVPHGSYVMCHPNGVSAVEGMYRHNKRHGHWTRFTMDGKPYRWEVWNEGVMIEAQEVE